MPVRPEVALYSSDAVMMFNQSLISAFCSALAGASAETSRQLVLLADNLAKGVGADERLAAHEYLGRRAQQAVLRSYDQVVTAREGAGSLTHYRADKAGASHRYAGRVLRNALASPAMVEASPEGLRFINVGELDRAARQWARLNFGAGGAGGGSRRRFSVTFSDVVVLTLGLDQAARPAFTMPRGVWLDAAGAVSRGGRGSGAFYPLSRVSDRPTRGIQARNFLDAGLNRLAEDFPPTYLRIYRRLYDQGRLKPSGVTGVARPGPVSSHTRTTALFRTPLRAR